MGRSSHCPGAPPTRSVKRPTAPLGVRRGTQTKVATLHPTRDSSTARRPDGPRPLPALICVINGQRYAIPLGDVLEVTRAAAVTTPSGAESTLVGYLDLRGDVLHVLGGRELLDLPSRPRELGDRFVVVRAGPRRVAIVVDRVDDVEEVTLIAADGTDGDDGMTVGRRARPAEGEGLVALIELSALLAASSTPQAAASAT